MANANALKCADWFQTLVTGKIPFLFTDSFWFPAIL